MDAIQTSNPPTGTHSWFRGLFRRQYAVEEGRREMLANTKADNICYLIAQGKYAASRKAVQDILFDTLNPPGEQRRGYWIGMLDAIEALLEAIKALQARRNEMDDQKRCKMKQGSFLSEMSELYRTGYQAGVDHYLHRHTLPDPGVDPTSDRTLSDYHAGYLAGFADSQEQGSAMVAD